MDARISFLRKKYMHIIFFVTISQSLTYVSFQRKKLTWLLRLNTARTDYFSMDLAQQDRICKGYMSKNGS
jgi:hypothetical protein